MTQHLLPSPDLILAKGRVTCPQRKYLVHKILSRNPLLINIRSSRSYTQVLYSDAPGRARPAGLGQGGDGHKLIIAVGCALGGEVGSLIHAGNINISHTLKSLLPVGKKSSVWSLVGACCVCGMLVRHGQGAAGNQNPLGLGPGQHLQYLQGLHKASR